MVCGVGINVNQRSFPVEITETATSLLTEYISIAAEKAEGTETARIDRKQLAECLGERFKADYASFCKVGNMSELKASYEALLANKDAYVRVLDPKGEYEGIALGINIDGELLVQKAEGCVEAVYAGEVSVRGIYGYV